MAIGSSELQHPYSGWKYFVTNVMPKAYKGVLRLSARVNFR